MVRRTKDNKPKVYGECCDQRLYQSELAKVDINGELITVYKSDHALATRFDNFVTDALPSACAGLCTQSSALCLEARKSMDKSFWETLPSLDAEIKTTTPPHTTVMALVDCLQ